LKKQKRTMWKPTKVGQLGSSGNQGNRVDCTYRESKGSKNGSMAHQKESVLRSGEAPRGGAGKGTKNGKNKLESKRKFK